MRRLQQQNRRQWWWVAGLLLLVVLVITIYLRSLSPYQSVRKQAEQIATTRADLKEVDGFWWYQRKTSYVSVAGVTKKNKKVYVVIDQKSGKVTILDQAKGMTRQNALDKVKQTQNPTKILTASLGKRGKDFVWDIGYLTKSGKLSYVTYRQSDGEEVNAIKNL